MKKFKIGYIFKNRGSIMPVVQIQGKQAQHLLLPHTTTMSRSETWHAKLTCFAISYNSPDECPIRAPSRFQNPHKKEQY
jgi:hypothetical protein